MTGVGVGFDVNRFDGRQATSYWTSRGYGVRYPSPFFDVAQQFLPENVHQLHLWCRYYFLTNPVINVAVQKMAEYPVTPIVWETDDERLAELYSNAEAILRLRQFNVEIGLDHFAYGSGLASVFFQLEKYLVCKNCRARYRASKNRGLYKWRSGRFFLRCPKCNTEDFADQADNYPQNVRGARLIRWNPENVEIHHNEITGNDRYYYKLPRAVLNDVRLGDPEAIETLPYQFLEAARVGRALLFRPDNIFHLKRATIAQKDQGWGAPLIYPVLKDAFYLQVMKKAQESLLLEHVVPLRILFPGPTTGGNDGPFGAYNLVNWKQKIDVELSMWKRDHNYIPILPMNVGYQQIGGQAKALILHQEFRIHAEQMLAGMGIPVEFVYGGLQWCGDPNSRIFTNEGLLSLKDVCPTNRGTSRREEGLSTVTRVGVGSVSWSHRVVEKPVVHLKTDLGLDARTSPDHRWCVLTPELEQTWRRTADLLAGDKIMVRYGMGLWPQQPPSLAWYTDFACREAADQLKRDTTTRYPVELSPRMSCELARILGYLVAEGSVTGATTIHLGNTDLDLLGDLLDCCEDVLGYRPTLKDSTNDSRFGSLPQWAVKISRRKAVLFLQAIMGRDYANAKTVPELIRRSPEKYVCEFLRAYFEGDGGVTNVDEKQMVFCASKSESLLKDVQLLLLNLGIVASRYWDEGQGMWALQIRGHHVDRFAEKIGFVSERKCSVLKNRTPTSETHVSDRIPFVKEALDAFRTRWFAGGGVWIEDEKPVVPNQSFFTPAEAGDVIGRSKYTIYLAVKSCALYAERAGESLRIPRWALEQYVKEVGVHRRPRLPCRDAWGATQRKLRNADLSLVWEKEPTLAARIEALIRPDVLWAEVTSVRSTGEVIEMCDLTEDTDHSFACDGLISHNSASNTALRALENAFLSYNIERYNLNRFLIDRVAAHMGWPRVSFRFEKFRMADDLQRAMFYYQLKQGGEISSRRMLEEVGEDFDKENDRMREESKKQIDTQRKTQLASADIQGAALLRTARYQAKAQELQMKAQADAQIEVQQTQAAAGVQVAQPGDQGQPDGGKGAAPVQVQPGEQQPQQPGDAAQQIPGLPQGATAYDENASSPNASAGPTAMAGMESPLQSGQGGVDLRYVAQRAAAYLKTVREQNGPQAFHQEMERMQLENPPLYQLTVQLMADMGSKEDPTNALKAPISARPFQRDASRNVVT